MKKHRPILVADDDADDRYFIGLAFQEALLPDKLVMVEHGGKVLEYLDKISNDTDLPGLIVLDINMPILDGICTLARLKTIERYQGIPVVVLTTGDSAAEKAKTVELGAVRLLHNFADDQNF